MKVLLFCAKPPLPAIDGGCLASYRLSMDLMNAGVDLHLLTIATDKHPYLENEVGAEYRKKTKMEAVKVDASLSLAMALINLFESRSIQEKRFKKKEVSDKLIKVLKTENPDAVLFDDYRTALYMNEVREHSDARCIYRSVNIEYTLMEQRSEEEGFLKKAYLKLQAGRLKRMEAQIWESADGVWSISDDDIREAGKQAWKTDKALHLPFSIECPDQIRSARDNSLFHLGSMDWEPNIRGILWFCHEVWPKIRKADEKMELHLGGRGIDHVSGISQMKGVTIHTEVPDAEEFCERFDMLIVPLFSGSGTRIKILQAMARGNLVISTPIGMRGISAAKNKHYLEADNGSEFAQRILEIAKDPEKKEVLKKAAQEFIRRVHDPDSVGEKLKDLLTQA